MNVIKINGVTVEAPDGASVSVVNGRVVIDGSPYDGLGGEKLVSVEVRGYVGTLHAERCDVHIHGDVTQGGVKADGSVKCDQVVGGVTADGNVNCGNVNGSVTADGNVVCGNVTGSVKADGNLVCRK